MTLPPILQTISKALDKRGDRAVLVGGAVRDRLLGRQSKDYDVEVYGLSSLDELETILSGYGSVNLVGRSFGVLKLAYEGEEYDFSMPRTETKSGAGHRGFDVLVDGSMDFADAARRRDFTINALGYDIASGEMLDPFGGLDDMERRVLRHIDDETFVEDPLRVYRAVQFAARFGYELDSRTFELCGRMVTDGMLDELPRERIYAEWRKLLLKSPKPSIGFELMRELGILRYYPELEALIETPQDPKWHPEGDVWVHTLLSIDAMERELGIRSEELGISDRDRLRFLFAILCHDLGKATHTTIEFADGTTKNWQELSEEHQNNILSQIKSEAAAPQTETPHSSLLTPHSSPPTTHSFKRIRAFGHETAGVEPARSFLYRLSNEHDFIESILPLVEHHLKPSQFYKGKAKPAAIRRLATKVNISELVLVAKADFLGRDTDEARSGKYEAGEWLMERAKNLNVQEKPLANILQGRDLIALGLEPSPRFKEILDDVYKRYLSGKLTIRGDAEEYVKRKYL